MDCAAAEATQAGSAEAQAEIRTQGGSGRQAGRAAPADRDHGRGSGDIRSRHARGGTGERTTTGRFGDNKVFIYHVFQTLRAMPEYFGLSLGQFSAPARRGE